jgi:DnaJ-class molecular chaperone
VEPNRCVCFRCNGKGFDRGGSKSAPRSSRKCPRCRGKGYTTVGRTKR